MLMLAIAGVCLLLAALIVLILSADAMIPNGSRIRLWVRVCWGLAAFILIQPAIILILKYTILLFS